MTVLRSTLTMESMQEITKNIPANRNVIEAPLLNEALKDLNLVFKSDQTVEITKVHTRTLRTRHGPSQSKYYCSFIFLYCLKYKYFNQHLYFLLSFSPFQILL